MSTTSSASAMSIMFVAVILEKLFDAPRFARNLPTLPFESKRLAQGLAQLAQLGVVLAILRKPV